jgi:hypothetical protein
MILTLGMMLSPVPPTFCKDKGTPGKGISVRLEALDSLRCWCSPLWGHNAPKIVRNQAGETWVAEFSGEYPEATVQILKRGVSGSWQRGKIFKGAYQPSLLFLDAGGRLNVIQNSQTKPILHFRSTDAENLHNFEQVAEGNGQEGGRGWYVGVGIHTDTVYMAYITLSYDLFLTWKRLMDPVWNSPVAVHRGKVDTVKGNHSWTRPRFQFSGRHGLFVVNETSDGSVKNTYNKVQLVGFDLSDPHQFTTETVDSVPMGFGAYSCEFAVSPDGYLHCVFERNPKIYESGVAYTPEPGMYVASRPVSGGSWIKRRVFDVLTDGILVFGADGGLVLLRIQRSGLNVNVNRLESPADQPAGAAAPVWVARRSADHGATWSDIAVESGPATLTAPTHIQAATPSSGSSLGNRAEGLFEDYHGPLPGTKLGRYSLYYFIVNGD